MSVSRTAQRIAGVLRMRIFALSRRVDAHLVSRADGFPHLYGHGGRLLIAERVRLFPKVSFYFESDDALISVGKRTFINRRSELIAAESIIIGSDCAISWDVQIVDTDFHSLNGRRSAAIVIGDNVWIGSRVTVLKSVVIGDGAVVAAGSVVTRSVPPGALVAGVPARVIRTSVTWSL